MGKGFTVTTALKEVPLQPFAEAVIVYVAVVILVELLLPILLFP
jgi:hypothetical protein